MGVGDGDWRLKGTKAGSWCLVVVLGESLPFFPSGDRCRLVVGEAQPSGDVRQGGAGEAVTSSSGKRDV